MTLFNNDTFAVYVRSNPTNRILLLAGKNYSDDSIKNICQAAKRRESGLDEPLTAAEIKEALAAYKTFAKDLRDRNKGQLIHLVSKHIADFTRSESLQASQFVKTKIEEETQPLLANEQQRWKITRLFMRIFGLVTGRGFRTQGEWQMHIANRLTSDRLAMLTKGAQKGNLSEAQIKEVNSLSAQDVLPVAQAFILHDSLPFSEDTFSRRMMRELSEDKQRVVMDLVMKHPESGNRLMALSRQFMGTAQVSSFLELLKGNQKQEFIDKLYVEFKSKTAHQVFSELDAVQYGKPKIFAFELYQICLREALKEEEIPTTVRGLIDPNSKYQACNWQRFVTDGVLTGSEVGQLLMRAKLTQKQALSVYGEVLQGLQGTSTFSVVDFFAELDEETQTPLIKGIAESKTLFNDLYAHIRKEKGGLKRLLEITKNEEVKTLLKSNVMKAFRETSDVTINQYAQSRRTNPEFTSFFKMMVEFFKENQQGGDQAKALFLDALVANLSDPFNDPL